MRLAAIYIPKYALPHLFGEKHEGVTLNLGGKCFYNFNELGNTIKLIDKVENKNFINSFWGENISLVSAIVGANGTGKTSILRTLIQEFKSNPPLRNCILIYEHNESTQILNDTKLNTEYDTNDYELINKSDTNEAILYYSPNLDYDLQDIHSSISLIDYHKSDLQKYYLGNIRRHLFFLKNNELIDLLKINFKDFPSYGRLSFKAKALYKSDFEKFYIQTTLGNKLYRIRNNLLSKVGNDEGNVISLTKKDIENVFNNSATIQDQLKLLWETYKVKDNSKTQYLHDGSDFYKNVEVNILSYLVLADTFSLDGDYGSYPFSKILEAKSFEDKLIHFLHKYIIQASQSIYKSLTNNGTSLDVNNFEKIKVQVIKFSNPKTSYKGVDYEKNTKNVIKQIELIESVYNFHKTLVSFCEKGFCSKINGDFEFDIRNADIKVFNELLNSYEYMLTYIKIGNLNSVLEIKPNKKLSTGEKSLLDMYASIYDYLKRWSEQKHMYSENCILLLDEPEQGYHPLWKKKFIQAITSTLPELFKINPVVKKLQIIFTTHDPLTLSDIPNDNITYLEKVKTSNNDITKVLNRKEQVIKKSFGANINDLLSDSFFVKGSLMGDFAKEKIEETIKWINKTMEHPTDVSVEKYNYYKQVISIIDEPIIRLKLSEMLEELILNNKDFQKEMIQKEIDYLINKKENL